MKRTKLYEYLENVGVFFFFIIDSYKSVKPFPPFKHIFKDFYEMSIKSLPIIILTASFMGIIMSYQLIQELRSFGAETYVGGIVGIAILRELGPVFAALILAGRLSSGIAAEIGSMRISEQIDALEMMAVNPQNYLVAPRFIAAGLMIPLLTVITDVIAIAGAYLVAAKILHIPLMKYIDNVSYYVESIDVISGLFKSFVFSQIIALVGAYFGFFTKGGAEGVGKSTTNAVVYASILILLADYFLTSLFFR